jgi:hypothetical protein
MDYVDGSGSDHIHWWTLGCVVMNYKVLLPE